MSRVYGGILLREHGKRRSRAQRGPSEPSGRDCNDGPAFHIGGAGGAQTVQACCSRRQWLFLSPLIPAPGPAAPGISTRSLPPSRGSDQGLALEPGGAPAGTCVRVGPLAADQGRASAQLVRGHRIFRRTDDMVGSGLVNSLARPNGNTTGVTILAADLDGKRQEILIEAVPGIRGMAALTIAR
jgi:hypothetical protein